MEKRVTLKGWISAAAVSARNSSTHPDFIPSRPCVPIGSVSSDAVPRTENSSLRSIRNIAQSAATALENGVPTGPATGSSIAPPKPESVKRNRIQQQKRDLRRRLADLANNNSALDLKASVAGVWLLGPAAEDLANNTLASAQVFILQGSSRKPPLRKTSCKQHPSGLPADLA